MDNLNNMKNIATTVIFLLLVVFPARYTFSEEITLWFIVAEYLENDMLSNNSEEEIKNFKQKFPFIEIKFDDIQTKSLKVLLENEKKLETIEDFRKRFVEDRELIIKVEFISWHNKPFDKILSSAQKEGADIVQIGSTWTAPLIAQNILEDITEVVQSVEDQYHISTLQTCKMAKDTRYFALPWGLDIRTWFYNKALFKEAGIEAENIKSLTDLDQTCKRFNEHFQEKGISFLGLTTSPDDYSTLHTAMAWIWGWGGKLIDEKKRVRILDSEAIDGMTHYVELAIQGCLPLPDKDNEKEQLIDIETDFLAGSYGMIFTGTWIINDILAKDNFNDFQNLGSLRGKELANSFLGGSHIALIKSSQTNFESYMARELIKYLSEKGSFDIGLPPQKGRLFDLLQTPLVGASAKVLMDQEMRTLPSIAELGEVEDIMKEHIAAIFYRAGKLSNPDSYEVRNIIKDEFIKADKKLKKVIKPDIEISYYVLPFALFLIIAAPFLLLRRPYMTVFEGTSKFEEAKNILHRTQLVNGEIESTDELNKARNEFLTNINQVIQLLNEIKRATREETLNKLIEFTKKHLRTLRFYKKEISKKKLSPVQYEKNVRTFFKNNIRLIINEMFDVLEHNVYVNPQKLNELVAELSKRYRFNYSFKENEATLKISYEDLKGCLDNLLGNATKSVSQVKDKDILLKVFKCDKHVCLSICDKGEGISSVKMKEIKDGKSTGHGLKDIKDIMSRWNGTLDIQSEGWGLGAKFTLKIKMFRF